MSDFGTMWDTKGEGAVDVVRGKKQILRVCVYLLVSVFELMFTE